MEAIGKCRRHTWRVGAVADDPCLVCEHPFDPVRSAAGKAARIRGHAHQDLIAEKLGMRSLHDGGAVDLQSLDGTLIGQAKSGRRYHHSMAWRAIEAMGDHYGTRFLASVNDQGEQGMITMRMDDWLELMLDAQAGRRTRRRRRAD